MLKIVRPVSFVLLSAAFCSGGVVHASDRAAITPRVGISQQEGSLKGTVSDSFGPVAGASIVVKGTTNGTVTDMNGNFVLDVKNGDVIQVSFIGYLTQEFKYNGEPSINVSLQEDTQKLDEVIVVGYGTQQKANLSGAVAQLDSKELTSRPISNVSSGLQGMMPGVTVTSGQGRPGQDGSTIRIRGVGTLNSASPYILIDGIESGSMNDIDPNDIESISVLKDASSAAIYGSKASNGVILITTKRGKTGAPRISYNGYVGASKATSMIDRVSSADYARLWNRFEPGRYSDEDIRMFEDGSDPYGHPNTDWNDEAYRTGLLHKHNVSITGGAENVKYMASAGYLGQTGILPNSDRKQFNGRTNLDMQLTKKLAVRMNMSFIKNDFSDPNASYYGGSSDQIIRQLNIISPMIPVKDKDGKYGQTNDGNPIAWLDSGQTVDNCNQNFTGALSVDYDIIDGLKATVTGAYVNEDQRHTERVLSIPDDPASASRTTSLVERFVNWKRYNFDALLNYSKNFGQHGLKVMVGYHAEKYEVSKNQMQRNNFPSNSLNDMDAGGASTQTNDGLSRELAMLSYFGRINYDFAGKYLLEANFRADASSRFAPGHRWGYFPSFSGAWRISEEEFMESTHDWLSSLKIRASWGMLGNQDALNKSNPWENQYYPWMQTYNLDGNYPMGGNLTTGSELKIEHSVVCENVDISTLITMGTDSLEAMRQGSIDGEQKAYEIVVAAAKQWEQQAAATQTINRALEYLRTPEIEHTGNQWKDTDNWRADQKISNRVYQMTCSIWEDTKYDRETKQSVPIAWYVTWEVRIHSPKQGYGEKIAGQNQKRYTDKNAAIKYLDGRKKAYSHLFTEISPPIPKEYERHFMVHGTLLPGYTVEGLEQTKTEHAAEVSEGGIFTPQNQEKPSVLGKLSVAKTQEKTPAAPGMAMKKKEDIQL